MELISINYEINGSKHRYTTLRNAKDAQAYVLQINPNAVITRTRMFKGVMYEAIELKL